MASSPAAAASSSAPGPVRSPSLTVSTDGACEKFCDAGGKPLEMILFLHVGPMQGTVYFALAEGVLPEIVLGNKH
jgi:hypothetical protein